MYHLATDTCQEIELRPILFPTTTVILTLVAEDWRNCRCRQCKSPLSEFHPRLLQLGSDPAPSKRHPMGPDLRGAIRRNDSRLFSLPPTIVIARYYLLLTSSSPFPSSFYNISYIYIIWFTKAVVNTLFHPRFEFFPTFLPNDSFTQTFNVHFDLPILLSQFYFFIKSLYNQHNLNRITVNRPTCSSLMAIAMPTSVC